MTVAVLAYELIIAVGLGRATMANPGQPLEHSADSALKVLESMQASVRMLKARLGLASVSIQKRFQTVPGDTTLYMCASSEMPRCMPLTCGTCSW
jgi:hypothetical protein